ncbi:single-stranded-DNA-specific exonuclease RecJ [Tepidibacillus fermentans]|uniref:Single-stranded-DNA-specific exonuclease RecJ n=1 Tax=Tepidibacillus fermentans TaxID=1281767 RepID=A0A4R3KKQ2_9BACI|nr:single-stranded-DNA-specific exonuclease RecJ [Tepidibacillus fermentans]TCS83831.1 exonuclease RecJ [Tepidibacillus fermentans]
MLEPKKRWFIQEVEDEIVEMLARETGLDPVVVRLLAIRGLKKKEEIERFLNHDVSMLYDPFLFLDMKKAVNRVHTAIVKGEKVLIYGDYDADGVTSTTMMYKTLKQLRTNFDYYIPNRFTEGYGLNKEALEEAAKQGFQVVITVDTGISAVEEAHLAKQLGLDLIITDHHEPPAILPDAFAIINPKTPGETYPFKLLAGVGVAFKFAHALLGRIPMEYIDIAAIGTIGDLVPLIDENRIIARAGLEQLAKTEHIGLQALLEEAGLKGKKITTGHVGFGIVPRINASGRLETADHAVRLFITEEEELAKELANTLGMINQERQEIVEMITKEAFEIIESHEMQKDKVLVVAKENWNVGVIGIVASRILEKYYRPTIVLSIDPETRMAKGSARSIVGYDIYQALTEAKDLLPHYGGHTAAAGLSIHEKDIPQFRQKLNLLAEEWLNAEDFIPTENVDMVCNLDQITIPLIEQIEKMEPFGMGNPSPKWMIEKVEIAKISTIGKDQQHLKMTVANQNKMIEALAFKMGHLNKEIAASSEIRILGELNVNEWNGEKKPQIMIRDFQIPHLQIFDWRNRKVEEESLKELDHEQALIFYDEEVQKEELSIFQLARKISYQRWEKRTFTVTRFKQVVLYDLPPRVSTMEEIMGELKEVEKLYCIYENFVHTKYRFDPAPNRNVLKQVYSFLRKHPELKQKEKAEHFFKKLGISSETFHFILEVFRELGFIIVDGDILTLHPNPEKKELVQSLSYRKYLEKEKVKEIFLYSNTKNLRDWFLHKSKRN